MMRIIPAPDAVVYDDLTGIRIPSEGRLVPFLTRSMQRGLETGELDFVHPGNPSAPTYAAASMDKLALLHVVPGAVCKVLGHHVSNDAGGGDFYAAYESTDAAVAGMTIAAPGGRWKRYHSPQTLNVKWFGAKGDGVADDTSAIQAAINFALIKTGPAPYAGAEIVMPPGQYRITSTLYIAGGQLHGNLTLRGSNNSGSGLCNTQLLWDGVTWNGVGGSATQKPAIWVEASCCVVADMYICPINGKYLYSGIEIGSTVANVAKSLTHNTVRGVAVVGSAANPVNVGVGVGVINPQGTNLENYRFEKCLFTSCNIGTWINWAQPINTVFDGCLFSNDYGGIAKVGLYVSSNSSTIAMYDCDFQSLEMAIQTTNGCSSISVTGGESENCKKFFYGYRPAAALPGSLAIRNMRLSPSQVGVATTSFAAADVDYIINYAGIGLTIENCFAYVSPTALSFKIAFPQSCRVVSRANDWPNAAPFRPFADYANNCAGGIWSTADRAVTGGSELSALPTLHGAYNPTGTATISGTATSVAVTLPNSEMFADYQVRLDVDSVTGAPTTGAFCGYVTSKTATGFTITVPTAPGTGTSVVYRYTTWR